MSHTDHLTVSVSQESRGSSTKLECLVQSLLQGCSQGVHGAVVSSEDSAGERSTSTFSPMVVSRTQFLEGCHYQRSFNFLPHGSVHEAAHNIAAKFFRVSKRESERGEQEGSQRLCNLLWEVESSREDSTGILTRSKSVGPVHTQWEGLQMNTRKWGSQGAFLKAASHKHIATTFPLPLLHYCG